MTGQNSHYPRPLTTRERGWLEWILPADRPGYVKYRNLLNTMQVLGEGRRGKGNIVMGLAGDVPDVTSPLPPVFAYGAIETNLGPVSVTIREHVGDQIDVEIVGHKTDEVPETFEEGRRWTYSTWRPGDVCPQCGRALREVPMHAPGSSAYGFVEGQGEASKRFVLALCAADRRLWVCDEETQVNHLIPVTNFYNELMLHKNVRDPKVALDSNQLFSHLLSFADADLSYAFLTYNKLKTKVNVQGSLITDKQQKATLRVRLGKFFTRHDD